MSSDPSLRRWYRQFNALYFEGRLPDDARLVWDACGGDLGEVHWDSDGLLIKIDPTCRFSRRLSKMNLLHELAHVGSGSYKRHGKKFNDMMLELAVKGAFKGLW